MRLLCLAAGLLAAIHADADLHLDTCRRCASFDTSGVDRLTVNIGDGLAVGVPSGAVAFTDFDYLKVTEITDKHCRLTCSNQKSSLVAVGKDLKDLQDGLPFPNPVAPLDYLEISFSIDECRGARLIGPAVQKVLPYDKKFRMEQIWAGCMKSDDRLKKALPPPPRVPKDREREEKQMEMEKRVFKSGQVEKVQTPPVDGESVMEGALEERDDDFYFTVPLSKVYNYLKQFFDPSAKYSSVAAMEGLQPHKRVPRVKRDVNVGFGEHKYVVEDDVPTSTDESRLKDDLPIVYHHSAESTTVEPTPTAEETSTTTDGLLGFRQANEQPSYESTSEESMKITERPAMPLGFHHTTSDTAASETASEEPTAFKDPPTTEENETNIVSLLGNRQTLERLASIAKDNLREAMRMETSHQTAKDTLENSQATEEPFGSTDQPMSFSSKKHSNTADNDLIAFKMSQNLGVKKSKKGADSVVPASEYSGVSALLDKKNASQMLTGSISVLILLSLVYYCFCRRPKRVDAREDSPIFEYKSGSSSVLV